METLQYIFSLHFASPPPAHLTPAQGPPSPPTPGAPQLPDSPVSLGFGEGVPLFNG